MIARRTPSYRRPRLERETHIFLVQCAAYDISPDNTCAVLAIVQRSVDERGRPKRPQ